MLYNVPHVGQAVGGMLAKGQLHERANVLVGPLKDGSFEKVTVGSIRCRRQFVGCVNPGEAASIPLNLPHGVTLRRGMVLSAIDSPPPVGYGYTANLCPSATCPDRFLRDSRRQCSSAPPPQPSPKSPTASARESGPSSQCASTYQPLSDKFIIQISHELVMLCVEFTVLGLPAFFTIEELYNVPHVGPAVGGMLAEGQLLKDGSSEKVTVGSIRRTGKL